MKQILLAFLALFAINPAHAVDGPVDRQWQGVWSLNCADPVADAVTVEPTKVSLRVGGKSYDYNQIELSYTFGEGARASGKSAWLLVQKNADAMYSFVGTVPGAGRKGPMVLDEGADGEGSEAKPLWGKKLQHCNAKR